MAKSQHHPGYADQDQQDDVVEALKVEHALHVSAGRKDRADQVTAYAKQLGATLTTRKTASDDE